MFACSRAVDHVSNVVLQLAISAVRLLPELGDFNEVESARWITSESTVLCRGTCACDLCDCWYALGDLNTRTPMLLIQLNELLIVPRYFFTTGDANGCWQSDAAAYEDQHRREAVSIHSERGAAHSRVTF